MPIDPSEGQTETGQSAVESPGSLLRQARIDRGLDEKDIAERLHITVHYVKAIEDDKYEKLPGIVFARGYMKSYATTVGLDPELVLQNFALLQPGQQPEKTQRHMAPRKKSRNRSLQWAAASIACFTLLIGVAWYLNDTSGTDSSGAELSGSSPATARQVDADSEGEPVTQGVSEEVIPGDGPPEQEPMASDSGPEPDAENAIAVSTGDSLPPTLQEPVSSAVESQSVSLVSEPIAAADEVREPEADAVPVDSALAESNASRPEELTDVNVLQGDNGERIIAVDAHGQDVLRIRFSGESWVEINDGDDRQIYRDLREQGDILEVSGHAPFNILLGDAPYTSLNFNGADIDVTDNIRIDNSARLTVGL